MNVTMALMSPEARRAKRAIGAVVLISFGAAWLILAANRSTSTPYLAYAGIAVAAVAYVLMALRVRKRALKAAGPPPPETKQDRRRDRWFHAINIGQWIVIFVTGNVLINIGLADWILPAIILIVGLHFFPLARLFASASHYLTGTALIAVACLYPFLAPAGPTSASGPALTGLVLWASATWALRPTED